MPEAKALHVLMVAARAFPSAGGVETHVRETSRRLAALGLDVTVLSTDPAGCREVEEEWGAVHLRRVRAWPPHGDYYFAPRVYSTIRRGRWDLVHCQGCHTFVPPLAMSAARRAGLPYVLTLHSGGHSSRLRNALRPLQWTLLRPLVSRAAAVVAVSEFEALHFARQMRLPRARFTVIPNGSDLPVPTRPDREEGSGRLILSVGRLERYKGHRRVVEALPTVLEQCPDARLQLVGTGPDEPALRQLAARLGVADRVSIRSLRADERAAMSSLVASAALVVLLSAYESQGIAALEALTLGRPVLVAYASALRELADRGLASAVPLGSSAGEVAAAIVGQLRRPLAPPRVALPTWDDCARAVRDVYQSVLQPAQRAPSRLSTGGEAR